MGRKFRKYLPKGYSQKGFNKVQNECSAQSEGVSTEIGLQTVDVESTSVETQTKDVITASVTTQTDGRSVNDVGVQTNERSVNNVGVQTCKTQEDYLCIGNSDEKFAPLVTKHDGVFKDASGMSV